MKASLNLVPETMTYRYLQALLVRLRDKFGWSIKIKLNSCLQALWNEYLRASVAPQD